MKEMSKAKIIDKRSERSVKNERDLLSKINHPFIVNMHFSFQDSDNLYLVMDLLTGGDLRYHICKNRKFSEIQSKFFIGCILLGLEYCHRNKIIHRDIKPENLVLDSNGYVHITDFGIAKIQQLHNAKETSGTPGYMSPEVMFGHDHNILVDYFAVGVMGYEFLKGYRPYLGKNRKEIKEKMISHQAHIKKSDLGNWSLCSMDFINKLLMRKPSMRLGYKNFLDVKNHDWFKNFNWKDLYQKKLTSPFIPSNADNFDYKYCNAPEKQGLNTQERYAKILLREDYKFIFKDYAFFNRYSDNGDNWFKNIHEIIYSDDDKQRENDDDIFNNYSINQIIKEQNQNTLKYSERSKKIKFDDNEFTAYEDFKTHKLTKKKTFLHIRAISSISSGGKKAFFEANNYINDRKLKRNQSLLNKDILLRKNNIKPINNNENNENKDNNFSKTLRISESSKLMKFNDH